MNPADPFPLADLQTAVRRGVLASLPPALLDAVLADAVRSEVPKGRFLDGPPLCLIVGGLIRVALTDRGGRSFAVSYLRQGDIAGLARVTGRRFPLQFQAVIDCRLLCLREAAFEELRHRHAELGVAVTDQVNSHLDGVLYETALGVFGQVRQRVVRHVLALAVIHEQGPATCSITHQELADAVGSARETISRVIGELKAEGLIGAEHGLVTVADPDLLRRELGA